MVAQLYTYQQHEPAITAEYIIPYKYNIKMRIWTLNIKLNYIDLIKIMNTIKLSVNCIINNHKKITIYTNILIKCLNTYRYNGRIF